MDLSIVFPMFWGREKKEIVKEGIIFMITLPRWMMKGRSRRCLRA